MTAPAAAAWGPVSTVGLGVAGAAFVLDQAHKWWMLAVYDIAARQPVRVLPFLDLVLAWNRGVSYGWFASHSELLRWGLAAMAVIIVAVLWRWLAQQTRPLNAAAIGLVIGGALGNAADRVVHSAVADFFLLHWGSFSWYVFNLADVAIVAGVALLLYDSFADRDTSPTGPA